MKTMRKIFSAALFCAMTVPLAGVTGTPIPTPSGTMPPEIYRTTVHPVCSALRTKVAPAIAMLKQNDKAIAASPKQFQTYVNAQFNGSKPQQNIAVLRLENLVSPLANNVLTIEKLLNDRTVFPEKPQNDDDKRKDVLKRQLMKSLAAQQAALDIINGFVQTQQLSALQHAGLGYIGAIGQPERTNKNGQQNAFGDLGYTPDPEKPQPFDDTLINAGLPPNPYEFDLTKVPGLVLGYNPVGKLKQGVEWTQKRSKKSETTLAKTVIETVQYCASAQAPPKP